MDFADLILSRLDELGLNVNQAEVAGGFSEGFIRGVVRPDGKRSVPNIEKASAICRALGLELYIGPPRRLLPPGFAEAEAVALDMVRSQAQGDGFEVVDWHPDCRRDGQVPMAFSRRWLDERGLDPDGLALVLPDTVLLSNAAPGGTVALVERGSMEPSMPALWCFTELGKSAIADVFRSGHVTIIRATERSERDRALIGSDLSAVRFLGRVVWLGLMPAGHGAAGHARDETSKAVDPRNLVKRRLNDV